MVRVRCRTSIDCAKRLEWPTQLDSRPIVGDNIRSPDSTAHKQIEMQVGSCTWLSDGSLAIELQLIPTRFPTIADFERWLKKPDSEVAKEINDAFRALDEARLNNK